MFLATLLMATTWAGTPDTTSEDSTVQPEHALVLVHEGETSLEVHEGVTGPWKNVQGDFLCNTPCYVEVPDDLELIFVDRTAIALDHADELSAYRIKTGNLPRFLVGTIIGVGATTFLAISAADNPTVGGAIGGGLVAVGGIFLAQSGRPKARSIPVEELNLASIPRADGVQITDRLGDGVDPDDERSTPLISNSTGNVSQTSPTLWRLNVSLPGLGIAYEQNPEDRGAVFGLNAGVSLGVAHYWRATYYDGEESLDQPADTTWAAAGVVTVGGTMALGRGAVRPELLLGGSLNLMDGASLPGTIGGLAFRIHASDRIDVRLGGRFAWSPFETSKSWDDGHATRDFKDYMAGVPDLGVSIRL